MNDELQMTNRGMPSAELRTPNRVSPTSTFETRNLRFASFDIRNSAFDISPIHHLAPQGMAGFVLSNGPGVAGSSNQSGEADIRLALIEADLVDCMVALPGQLFYSTQKFSLN